MSNTPDVIRVVFTRKRIELDRDWNRKWAQSPAGGSSQIATGKGNIARRLNSGTESKRLSGASGVEDVSGKNLHVDFSSDDLALS